MEDSPTTASATLASPWSERWESGFELIPQISILSPTSFMLNYSDYSVSYIKEFSGAPTFFLGFAASLAQMDQFQFLLEVQIGYGSKAGDYQVRSLRSSPPVVRPEGLRVHWIPIGVAAKARYHIPGIRWLVPSLSTGVGAMWLIQRGRSELMNESTWIPQLYVKPAVTFLDDDPGYHWFGGFSFSGTFFHSIASPHDLGGISVDLSLNLIL